MAIMLIFSSMCGLNLRIKRKIVMRCYYTTYLQVLEGCVEYFARISFVYPLYVAKVHIGPTCCDWIKVVLARYGTKPAW